MPLVWTLLDHASGNSNQPRVWTLLDHVSGNSNQPLVQKLLDNAFGNSNQPLVWTLLDHASGNSNHLGPSTLDKGWHCWLEKFQVILNIIGKSDINSEYKLVVIYFSFTLNLLVNNQWGHINMAASILDILNLVRSNARALSLQWHR